MRCPDIPIASLTADPNQCSRLFSISRAAAIRDPFRILHVGLMPRHVLDMLGVGQSQIDLTSNSAHTASATLRSIQ